MSKGKFRHPVRIRLPDISVPYTETSFVVKINAQGRFGVEGIIPIAYFGYIEDGIFYIESYSFSVQNLKQSTREAYGADPVNTAMLGLEMFAPPIRRG